MKRSKVIKAYNNQRFLHSADGRTVRMLCEYYEPLQRFRKQGVSNTIVFWGSSRARPLEVTEPELRRVETELSRINNPSQEQRSRLDAAMAAVRMSRYYHEAVELSKKITTWANHRPPDSRYFVVCSGGGPGIMEAANRGANEAGGKSAGLCISLPHEQLCNQYITPSLGFEFHYFFMRKYWFVYLAKALVMFPGGFGTFDEMFEVLTLVQTQKVTKPLAIILYGSEYWNHAINFESMIEWGTISRSDLNLFHVCNTPDEAFHTLVEHLTINENNHTLPE